MPGLMYRPEDDEGQAPGGAAPSQSPAEQEPDPGDQQEGTAADSDAGDDTDPQPNVSPEEQQAYDAFVDGCLALIYSGGKVNKGILDLLDDDPSDLLKLFGDAPELQQFSPVVALAGATVAIVLEEIRRGGDKPDDSVILQGGKEILEELAHMAGVGKVHDYSEEEMNRAVLVAMDLYREAGKAEGLVNDDDLKAQFAEIQQLDQQGQLAPLLGAGSGQQPPEQPPQGGQA